MMQGVTPSFVVAILMVSYNPNFSAMGYSPLQSPSSNVGHSRRQWLAKSAVTITTLSTILPFHQEATAKEVATATNPLPELVEAQTTLGKLLDNWKRATIDCTFADVPRELLEQKNKELLLEKASTFALFDKSVSVETCKTTNRIVRDYLGVTGKGPMAGIEKKLKRGLNYLQDVDDLDRYVTELESFSQAYSRASSLSYAAGIADFDSVNNFSKEDAADKGEADDTSSNLNQSKVAIQQAKASLDVIVTLLQKESDV